MQQTLNRRQDRGDIVRRGPPVLENVEAELAVGVHVGVEHAREELDGRGFVGVGFVKGEDEFEGAVFEGGVGCADAGVSTAAREAGRGGTCLGRISRRSIP